MSNPLLRPLPGDQLGLMIEAFIDDCEIANLSPGTIRYYRDKLGKFHRWCAETGVPLDPSRHDPQVARQFLRYLQSDVRWDGKHSSSVRKMTAGGIDSYYRALRRFYNWCMEQEFIAASPLEKVKGPKATDEQPDPFSEDELRRLFAAVEEQGGRFLLRNRAILAVLLDVGLRVSELCNLTVEDYNFQTGELLVRHGKGRKSRSVALGAQARRALRNYWLLQRKDIESPWLFTARADRQLTRNGIKMLLNRLGERAGVSPVNPHRFRHTAAIFALRAGMDAFSLQAMLGHTSMEMTRRYVRIANTDMIRAAKHHSPLDWLSRE